MTWSFVPLRITDSNIPISALKIYKDIKNAWKVWSDVVPMKFRKRGRKEADVVISFYHGGKSSLFK